MEAQKAGSCKSEHTQGHYHTRFHKPGPPVVVVVSPLVQVVEPPPLYLYAKEDELGFRSCQQEQGYCKIDLRGSRRWGRVDVAAVGRACTLGSKRRRLVVVRLGIECNVVVVRRECIEPAAAVFGRRFVVSGNRKLDRSFAFESWMKDCRLYSRIQESFVLDRFELFDRENHLQQNYHFQSNQVQLL